MKREDFSSVKLDEAQRTVTIRNLQTFDLDFFTLLAGTEESLRESKAQQVISVGAAVLNRVEVVSDIDWVERKMHELLSGVETTFASVKEATIKELGEKLDPGMAGSYTRPLAEIVGTAQKDLGEGMKTLAETFRVQKESMEKTLATTFNPSDRTSYVGRLVDLYENTRREAEKLFDPANSAGPVGRMVATLSTYFDGDGAVARLFDAKFAAASEKILKELQELRTEFAKQQAAIAVREEVEAKTPIHGRTFEDTVETRLQEIARPFGDTVSRVSTTPGAGGGKAGDFTVDINGRPHRLVIESRDWDRLTLPKIREDLARAMELRNGDFGIFVAGKVDALPRQVGPLNIYDHQIVTSLENLEIAYKTGRILLAVEKTQAEGIDVTAVQAKLHEIEEALRRVKAIRTRAGQVEKMGGEIQSLAEAVDSDIRQNLVEIEELLKDHSQV